MKQTNKNTETYKNYCLRSAEEYTESIRIFVSALAYGIEKEARVGYITNEDMKKMIDETMENVRSLMELRDKTLDRKDMFEI